MVVWVLILAYAAYFSTYTIARHDSLNSYAADLSFIDQPMWNTLHGRFLERTMGESQVSRVGEHLEPVILPLSLVFLVWDDVRASLILQTLALALGALPVYWIARRVFGDVRNAWGRWLPVLFALVYLSFPALQAANVADFHADPFIVTPLLLAFWYGLNRSFGWMWLWALAAMLTKENLPTLTFMLGLWWVLFPGRCRGGDARWISLEGPQGEGIAGAAQPNLREVRWHGVALMAVSLAWFLAATFLIVAPMAREVYGTDTTVYFANRYGVAGGAGAWLAGIVSDPQRWLYLLMLLAPVGGLALLAPEYLSLGLPVLAANFLSNFAGQYSGQQHYSAPLVPVFVLAAVFGARRLGDWLGGSTADTGPGTRRWVWPLVAVWLVLCLLGCQVWQGWTPLSRDFVWFRADDHTRLAQRFFDRVPAGVAVSTTPPLHPHLAHRPKVYLFPTVAEAEYVLLDVSGVTDAHPNDVFVAFEDLVSSGRFGILDAADGYVLLRRDCPPGECSGVLPGAFFDFARTEDAAPQYPLEVTFSLSEGVAPVVRCLGYDVVDDPFWRRTRLRTYWQVIGPVAEPLQLWPFVFSRDGRVQQDPGTHPLVAPIWYPVADWQAGETVVVETLPTDLGPAFSLGLAVVRGDRFDGAQSFADPARRLTVHAGLPALTWHGDTWVEVGAFERAGRDLVPAGFAQDLTVTDVRFDEQVQLLGYRMEPVDEMLSVVLAWRPETPLARDYTVFVHLVAANGEMAAQSDATPSWVAEWPTGRWRAAEVVLDGHRLDLPGDLPAGEYRVQVGLYDWQTLERLALLDEYGWPVGDVADLGVWQR